MFSMSYSFCQGRKDFQPVLAGQTSGADYELIHTCFLEDDFDMTLKYLEMTL